MVVISVRRVLVCLLGSIKFALSNKPVLGPIATLNPLSHWRLRRHNIKTDRIERL